MTIEQIIQTAIEGGYAENGVIRNFTPQNRAFAAWSLMGRFKELLLYPLFWKSLGVGLRWESNEKEILYKKDDFGDSHYLQEWLEQWHSFIDHIADGKTIESFFEKF